MHIDGGAMKKAPELKVQNWINTPKPLTLESLRGKVIVLHAFQMLCPGCTYHAIPQMQKLAKKFAQNDKVALIGIHTVFENHSFITEESLRVFIKENRLTFPIAVDMPDGHGGIPQTMSLYDMQGTPTMILIDQNGNLRAQQFGVIDDFDLGIAIGQLLAERN